MRLALGVCIAAGMLLLAGCGGGTSSSSGTSGTGSLFEGSFAGTYSSTQSQNSGAATLSIDSTGQISGTVVDPVNGSGTMTGSVTSVGSSSGSFTYPQAGTISYSGSFTLVGKTLTGTLQETIGGQPYTVTLSCTKSN